MFKPRTLEELASDWPKELDHISASSVKMIARCPEQWRRRYILGEKTPPGAALIAGHADHAAIEKSMRQKVTSYIDLPVPEVVDEFTNAFETEVNNYGVKEIEIKQRGELIKAKAAKVKILDTLKVEAGELVGIYHSRVSPQVQPVTVEEEFSFTLDNLPVRVDGRLDLIATTDIVGDYLIDRKRSGKTYMNAPDPEWTIQAEVYQLVREVPHAWHVSMVKKRNVEQFVQPPRPRSIAEQELEHLAGEIGYFFMRYGPEGPWPARGKLHTWACGFCGYRPDCWAWK